MSCGGRGGLTRGRHRSYSPATGVRSGAVAFVVFMAASSPACNGAMRSPRAYRTVLAEVGHHVRISCLRRRASASRRSARWPWRLDDRARPAASTDARRGPLSVGVGPRPGGQAWAPSPRRPDTPRRDATPLGGPTLCGDRRLLRPPYLPPSTPRDRDLVEIDAPVDPDPEAAEIHRRVIAAGGPALLFTNVKGGAVPARHQPVRLAAPRRAGVRRSSARFIERLVHLRRDLDAAHARQAVGRRAISRRGCARRASRRGADRSPRS